MNGFGYGSQIGMLGMNGLSGMGNMGSMGGINSSGGNIPQYFKSKYGCENCFRTEPYLQEMPKPITPLNKNISRPSIYWKILSKMFMG